MAALQPAHILGSWYPNCHDNSCPISHIESEKYGRVHLHPSYSGIGHAGGLCIRINEIGVDNLLTEAEAPYIEVTLAHVMHARTLSSHLVWEEFHECSIKFQGKKFTDLVSLIVSNHQCVHSDLAIKKALDILLEDCQRNNLGHRISNRRINSIKFQPIVGIGIIGLGLLGLNLLLF